MERIYARIASIARIDCDEWRLLCIPDRDRAMAAAAQCFIKLFLPGRELYFWIIGNLSGGWGSVAVRRLSYSVLLTDAAENQTDLLFVNQTSALAGRGILSTQPPKCYMSC